MFRVETTRWVVSFFRGYRWLNLPGLQDLAGFSFEVEPLFIASSAANRVTTWYDYCFAQLLAVTAVSAGSTLKKFSSRGVSPPLAVAGCVSAFY